MAFVFFILSVMVMLGQTPAAAPKTDETTASTPSTKEPPAAGAQTPSSKEASPATAETPKNEGTNAADAKDAEVGKKGKHSKDSATGGGVVSAKGVDPHMYVIGPEDMLFVNVFHQPDVSGNVPVRPDGYISMRFVGEVKAAGLTTAELAELISERLSKYFNRPEVNIQVPGIKSKKIYLSGEIRRPGPVPLTGPMTVLEAITFAGGPADFAKKGKIYILRDNQKLMFNYNDVIKGRHLEQNILLQNGDHIHIP